MSNGLARGDRPTDCQQHGCRREMRHGYGATVGAGQGGDQAKYEIAKKYRPGAPADESGQRTEKMIAARELCKTTTRTAMTSPVDRAAGSLTDMTSTRSSDASLRIVPRTISLRLSRIRLSSTETVLLDLAVLSLSTVAVSYFLRGYSKMCEFLKPW